MLRTLRKISTKKPLALIIFVIVIFQVLLIFQGFDVCDEGFSLTFYQQFFNDASSVEYNFVYYLSGLVGGLWYKLFPDGGIIAFRVLTVLVNTLTFYLAFKLLHKYLGFWQTVIGLFMVLFVNDFGFLAFYHNHLTSLLAVISITALFYGVFKTKNWLLVVAGVIVGINVMTRLINLSMLALILAIVYYGYLSRYKIRLVLGQMALFLMGFALGIFLNVLLLSALGHTNTMYLALESVMHLGVKDDSGHNLKTLLLTYFFQWLHVLLLALAVVSTIILSLWLIQRRSVGQWLLYPILIVFLAYLIRFEGLFFINSLGLVGTVWMLLAFNRKRHVKLLALLALIMLVVLPMGSGGGLKSSDNIALWLALPFFVYFVLNVLQNRSYKTPLWGFQSEVGSTNNYAVTMLNVFIAVFSLVKTYSVANQAYFDPGSRFDKTYQVQNPLANHVYTTQSRAEIVNTLLDNLENYVSEDDYVLLYDNIPMVHFLTKTRPYMYNPWVWIYDGATFADKLKKAETKIDGLPIVVQQKFTTFGKFSEPRDDYMREDKINDNLFNEGRTKAMNAFLKRHHYHIVWSNPYFNIYQADSKTL